MLMDWTPGQQSEPTQTPDTALPDRLVAQEQVPKGMRAYAETS